MIAKIIGDLQADGKPDSYLFVVEDTEAELFSPVFEQSSIAAAKRVYKLKTLKELPEGVNVESFKLHLVGSRRGRSFIMGDFLLMTGDKDE